MSSVLNLLISNSWKFKCLFFLFPIQEYVGTSQVCKKWKIIWKSYPTINVEASDFHLHDSIGAEVTIKILNKQALLNAILWCWMVGCVCWHSLLWLGLSALLLRPASLPISLFLFTHLLLYSLVFDISTNINLSLYSHVCILVGIRENSLIVYIFTSPNLFFY